MESKEVAEVNLAAMPREELDKLKRETAEEPAAEPEKSVEEPKEEPKAKEGEKTPKEGEASSEEVTVISAERDKLKKTVETQDKLLAKLGTELGMLRKKSPEEQREEIARIRDLWLEDPVAGSKALKEYEERERQEEESAKSAKMIEDARYTKQFISKNYPEFEKEMDGMVEMLKEDKAPDQVIRNFEDVPYLFDSALLVNLYRRSVASRELRTLKEENEKLKTENEELKKKPGEILRKIETASKTTTTTGKSAGASAPKENAYEGKPMYALSREELRKMK